MNTESLRIELDDDTFLVAEVDIGAHVMPYKEIYIGVEKGGRWWQDIAVVREKYHYNDKGIAVSDRGEYEILIYGGSDEGCYDYTEKITIKEHEGEPYED